jgi:hypothetical protein
MSKVWYITTHPEYRTKIDHLRKIKSKLDKNVENCSPEKHALKMYRKNSNGNR